MHLGKEKTVTIVQPCGSLARMYILSNKHSSIASEVHEKAVDIWLIVELAGKSELGLL